MEDLNYEEMDYEEQSQPIKRSGLASTSLGDWTTSFLSSRAESNKSPNKNEYKSKPNELGDVVYVTEASPIRNNALSRPTKTQSTLLHSEHIKQPLAHPEGISFSQPLPEDDDMYDIPDQQVDDVSIASSHTAPLDSPCSSDIESDDYVNENQDLLAGLQYRLKRLESSPAYGYSQYHFLLGVLKAMSRDFEGAVASFKQADQLFTPFVDLEDGETNLYHFELQTALANATVDAAVESVRVGNADPNALRSAMASAQTILSKLQVNAQGASLEAWNDICLLLLKAADLPAAIQMYHIVSQAFPQSADLQSNLATCMIRVDDVESAASMLQSTLTNHPSHVASLVNYASVLSSQNMHSTAAKILHVAVEIDRDSFHAWCNLAVQYQLMGENDKASLCFEAAKSLVDPQSLSGLSLGRNIANHLIARARTETNMEQKRRQIAAARELLSAVLHTHSRHASTIAALADCHELLGEHTEAMHQYDTALSISPDCFEALNGRGLVCLHQRNAHEAELMFARAVRSIDPSSTNAPPTMMNLATALIVQRRFADARSLLEKTLQLAEQQRTVDESRTTLDVLCGCLSMLGSINRRLCDLANAETHYRRCLDLDPTRVSALNGFALVYADAGRWREADELLERVSGSSSATPADIAAAEHNRSEFAKKKAKQ